MTTPLTSEAPAPSFAGRHVLAELRGVSPALLGDDAAVARALRTALDAGGRDHARRRPHRFEPQGTTVLALLAESHASVHAYPEAGAAFVDVFTCGEHADPERIVEVLGREVGAIEVRAQIVARGAGLAPDASGSARSTSRSPRGCGGAGGSTRCSGAAAPSGRT